jgi:hypothetical protein
MNARDYLREQLLEIGQYSYLVCYAADRVRTEEPSEISGAAPAAIARLCRNITKRPSEGDNIELDPPTVRKRMPGLQRWLIQSLIVRLDGILHGVLDRLLKRDPAKDSGHFEGDFSELLGDRHKESGLNWSYKDAVLLAVYRNCLLHGDGQLASARQQRLVDAGWGVGEWEQRISWTDPGYEDFLLFKRAVRTIGNACIQAAESDLS